MKTTLKQRKYHIPKNYYEPAVFALQMFHKTNQFNRSVDAAVAFFTADPASPHYVAPAKLDRNTLARHLLKKISNS